MGSLKNIKVLEFTHFIAGPYCGQTLADHGAEVIKIEPLDGEASRKSNPFYEGSSIYYEAMNRNKKSVALDLKSEEGKKVIHKLIKDSDILITNYSIGVPEKLGFGYDEISKINPQIIMVHITGFGLTGPKKDQAAFDGVIQAMSGISHLTGEEGGPPLKAGIFIADYIAAFNGVIGALMALQSRTISNKGQLVDVGMLDAMVSMLLTNFSEHTILGEENIRIGSRSKNVFASNFPTKDGYVYIAPLTEKMWNVFCEISEIKELNFNKEKYKGPDNRLKNYKELQKIIGNWSKEIETEELINLLNTNGVPCGKVNSISDLLEEEQIINRNMLWETDFEDTKLISPGVAIKMEEKEKTLKRAPSLGEHTEETLQALGYSIEEINQLVEKEFINSF